MPCQGPLNGNNAPSQASTLNIEVAPTSLTTTLPPSKKIYKQLTLVAVYYTNLLATAPNLYLVLAPHLVSTTYKDKVTTNVLEEPLPTCY